MKSLQHFRFRAATSSALSGAKFPLPHCSFILALRRPLAPFPMAFSLVRSFSNRTAADVPATVRHHMPGVKLPELDLIEPTVLSALHAQLVAEADRRYAEVRRLDRMLSNMRELSGRSVGTTFSVAAQLQNQGLLEKARGLQKTVEVLQTQRALPAQQRHAPSVQQAAQELQHYHLGELKFAVDFSPDYSYMQVGAL
jgi:hypothetical protein